MLKRLFKTHSLGDSIPHVKKFYSPQEADTLKERFAAIHTEYWNDHYSNPYICDGKQWSLTVRYVDGYRLSCGGSNAYPNNWDALLAFFCIDNDKDDDETERHHGKLIYCSVSINGGKAYYYTTDDESIKSGDYVIVPVGADNNELQGVVEDVGYYSPENVPFPFNRTKAILRKTDEFEDDKDGNMTES